MNVSKAFLFLIKQSISTFFGVQLFLRFTSVKVKLTIMKRMKFAHGEGHTDLTYSEDGANIITCGTDGDYRVWKGHEDDDPECICVGDEATVFAFENKKVFVGTDMHVLPIFSHHENQTDGSVTRATSTITHTSVNKDGSKVATCPGFTDKI